MATLTDDLAAQLQGVPASQFAQQLGISQEQSSAAIGAALPLLMGALGKSASQPQGAQALLGALQKDHAGMDIGSVLGAVLGGAGSRQTDGAGILGHIFGGSQPRAEAGIAQATGLGQGQASQLLKMLAPIVMAYLARRVMSGGSTQQAGSAQALGGLLGQEQQQIRQEGGLGGGLLGAVLDQDGDGELGIGDLMKLGGLFGRK
ncbi:DUF937 domain-containing protein [Luteimonas sp. Sa2BVA3]|uniref:DUF937 domain-containing protein n=1 Tax=Luteimonas colneyensis TaxID=2762230 RepID=A0ABR8UKD6_9GAMM|nr:DUF937 domain-containing protein [Luteimonas colneyensis]MBD7988463.1 DUF937 domain-containing protein [Luteimonas colneyensis]